MGLHDALSKTVYTEPRQAMAPFRASLPEALSAALDVEAMTVSPDPFVDEALKSRHTDVLYAIPWRAEVVGEGDESVLLLHMLFEHQSSVDPWMAFRMLRYAVRIWDSWLRKNREEGLQRGLQRGQQGGRQEGRQEALEAVARRLLAQGRPIGEICELTGLSADDVRALPA